MKKFKKRMWVWYNESTGVFGNRLFYTRTHAQRTLSAIAPNVDTGYKPLSVYLSPSKKR